MVNPSLVPPIDAPLLARYEADQQRPFDYPPLARFRDDFDERALRAVIGASNGEPIPRPLALCVRVPACTGPQPQGKPSRAAGKSSGEQVTRYLERLYREIELIAPLFDRDRAVRRLHLCGEGVPALRHAAVRELIGSLQRHFGFNMHAQGDYSFALDPLATDPSEIHVLAGLGFNCLVLRVAQYDQAAPGAAWHGKMDARIGAAMDAARAAQIPSVSVQLACVRAQQAGADLVRRLDAVLAWQPQHVVLCTRGAQDGGAALDARTATFSAAVQRLMVSGYVHLGMAHFARADDELAVAQRTGTLRWCFPGYWAHHTCDVVGLGVGAQSCIGESCSRSLVDVGGYAAALDDGRLPVACGLSLDEDDLIRRELMATLLGRCIVDKATFGARHRLLFDEYFVRERQRLRPLIADGLVEEDARALRVTSRGRLLLRIIGRCFDAYCDVETQAARHVRTL